VHSLKSETPLVDAMIMFMREFNVLASAESVKGLRALLRQDQLEVYGDPVTPEYVYDVIRNLPRFAGMRVSPDSAKFRCRHVLTMSTERAPARCGRIPRISAGGTT
jgi:hypothetical protein